MSTNILPKVCRVFHLDAFAGYPLLTLVQFEMLCQLRLMVPKFDSSGPSSDAGSFIDHGCFTLFIINSSYSYAYKDK